MSWRDTVLPMFRYANAYCLKYPFRDVRYHYHDPVGIDGELCCRYCLRPITDSWRTNLSGRRIYEASYVIHEEWDPIPIG